MNFLRRINYIRSIPAIVAFMLSKNKDIILLDIDRWVRKRGGVPFTSLKWRHLNALLMDYPEFRNVFYYRLDNKFVEILLRIFYPKVNSLYFGKKENGTEYIGPGLFVQHGFSTIVYARSIGENCWIHQQVTVGYGSKSRPPVIGNNVRIGAGAIVIGDIKIGNNVIIGAGAVVAKDVPDDCWVIGNPAMILRRNRELVKEPL